MISSKKKTITFLLVLEEKVPDVNFSLKNLPGSSKIDVVARNILATFPCISDFNVEYIAFFSKNNPASLTVTNLVSRQKPYDEIEIASLIKESLKKNECPNSSNKSALEHFKWQSYKDANIFFKEIKEIYESIFYLQENGEPFDDIIPKLQTTDSCLFIFGGRHDISEGIEKIVYNIATSRVSLGSRSYLASTCITYVLFELEKLEKNKPQH